MRWPVGVLLVVSLGCDPSALTGGGSGGKTKAESKADAEGGPETPAKAKGKAKEEAKAQDFGSCMAACAEAKTMSPTDRATCRLNCGLEEEQDPRDPSVVGKALVGRFRGCFEACPPKSSPNDRATCMLTCAQQAASGPEAKHWAPAGRGCASACLEQVGSCSGKCSGAGEDGATCQLQCTNLGQRCVGRCDLPEVDDGKAGTPTPAAQPGVPAPPGLPVPPPQ